MDLGVLEETIRLSTSAQDAVLYLCNSVGFANLVIQVLFPELVESAGSYDLAVLTNTSSTENLAHTLESPRQGTTSVADEVGLVVLDYGIESQSSNRISSSNSTIRLENSGPTRSILDDASTRKALFISAGCGFWEQSDNHQTARRIESKTILTALDLLSRVTSAVDLCIRKCQNEHNAMSSTALMDWIVRTGVWKYTPENAKFSTVCNGRAETHTQITQILTSHARRSGLTNLARGLTDWQTLKGEESQRAQMDSALDHDEVFVVDPRRMCMLALAQLLTTLNWQPQVARTFQLTDRHLIKPLLAVCIPNSIVAARLFASFDQLPKICAKLHQEANAQGLDECFKLLFPKEGEWSLENLPTSLISASSSSAAQWWESSDTILTLAQIVRGTSVPFSNLICALVTEDDSALSVAIEETYVLYALADLSDAAISFDPKRRALLSINGAEQQTSRQWCLRIFNSLTRRWLQNEETKNARAEELVKRTAATMEELKLLKSVLKTAAKDSAAQELLTPRIIWRTLTQAARNENEVAPPSIARYISPELLAECPTAVAPMITAFNLWWNESSSYVMSASFLRSTRAMISEHLCKVSAAHASAFADLKEGASWSAHESPFELETVKILDSALLIPTLIEDLKPRCGAFTLATLYFLVCGERRELLADQIIQSSTCSRPGLLRCLWTGEFWGELLKDMLIHYCVNSEESVHMMSVCTLLSAFPSYAALELVRPPAPQLASPMESPNVDELSSPPDSRPQALVDPCEVLQCRSLRGAEFHEHSIGGLLNEYIDPNKLLSIHAAREILKTITGLPEMNPCGLKFDAALCAVYESGKKHMNVLGLALSESVRFLLTDQMTMVKELESKCQKSLLRCVELADKTRQQVRDVCLSSTLCDVCGLLLTQHLTPPEIHRLEKEAFEGKVCAMNRCDHRYHALCLRSLTIALAPNRAEFAEGYTSVLKTFDSFQNIDSEESIKTELVRNLQTMVSRDCPLCSNDLTNTI